MRGRQREGPCVCDGGGGRSRSPFKSGFVLSDRAEKKQTHLGAHSLPLAVRPAIHVAFHRSVLLVSLLLFLNQSSLSSFRPFIGPCVSAECPPPAQLWARLPAPKRSPCQGHSGPVEDTRLAPHTAAGGATISFQVVELVLTPGHWQPFSHRRQTQGYTLPV